MQYQKIIEYLYSLEKFKGSVLGLENIKSLLKRLGNPEKYLKVIHVAGTNGKGTVSAMIAKILEKAGFKVGLYTSPHLIDLCERYRINDKNITKEDFVHYFNIIKKQNMDITFFEFITALAFLYFSEKKIDYLVLEVGLGGRLDATNVITPIISIITNIDLDHTQVLGNTVEKIAYEKAGIIKENIPVVTGAKDKALEILKREAENKNSKIFQNKEYKVNNGTYDINGHKNLKINLEGEYKKDLSTIAVTAIDVLNEQYNLNVSEDNIKDGLNDISWPGRFEFVKKNILIDCAHNPAGMKVLKNELDLIRKQNGSKEITLVLGIMKDKDIKSMVKIIETFADNVILTKAKSERASDPDFLESFFSDKNKIIKKTDNISDALQLSNNHLKKDSLLLITGSCYVVGKAMEILNNDRNI